jgi:hypothetical protein
MLQDIMDWETRCPYGGNPSSLDTQLDYMLHEGDWKMIENQMKTPGKSITDYMRLAK